MAQRVRLVSWKVPRRREARFLAANYAKFVEPIISIVKKYFKQDVVPLCNMKSLSFQTNFFEELQFFVLLSGIGDNGRGRRFLLFCIFFFVIKTHICIFETGIAYNCFYIIRKNRKQNKVPKLFQY